MDHKGRGNQGRNEEFEQHFRVRKNECGGPQKNGEGVAQEKIMGELETVALGLAGSYAKII